MPTLTPKKKKKLLLSYSALLTALPKTSSTRHKILTTHFGEFFTSTTESTADDLHTRIATIMSKVHPHPYIFLASSLGFNKMTWNTKVERVVGRFGLGMRLKWPSYGNYLKYERLKYLIMKYFDKRKELGLQNDSVP